MALIAREQRNETERQRAAAVRGRSNLLATVSEQNFRKGDYGTALALGAAALPDFSANNTPTPELAAVRATFNAYSNLVELKTLLRTDDSFISAMYLPDGRYIAISPGYRKIDVREIGSDLPSFSVKCWSCKPDRNSVDKDGKYFVSELGVEGEDARNTNIGALYDLQSGKTMRKFWGHTDWINSMSISSNGRRVVTASHDNTVKVWNVDNDSPIASLPLTYKMKGKVGFIRDENSLALLADFDVTLYQLERGGPKNFFRTRIASPPGSVVLKPDSRRIFVAAGHDVTAVALGSEAQAEWYGGDGEVRVLDYDPKSTKLAVGYNSGSISTFFDAQPARTRRVFSDVGSYDVDNVVFSPDGTRIAASAGDTIAILRASDLATIAVAVGHTGKVRSLSFSPDGQYLISAAADGTVRLWRASTKPKASFTSEPM